MTDGVPVLFMLGSDRDESLRRLHGLARPGDLLWLLPGALAALPAPLWPSDWGLLRILALHADWQALSTGAPPPGLELIEAQCLVELVERCSGPHALA